MEISDIQVNCNGKLYEKIYWADGKQSEVEINEIWEIKGELEWAS